MFEASAKMEEKGASPEAVARMVANALTAEKPKTRYIVGGDARIQIMMARLLPDRARDWMVLKFIGLRNDIRNQHDQRMA
jgi:hypothetical protein